MTQQDLNFKIEVSRIGEQIHELNEQQHAALAAVIGECGSIGGDVCVCESIRGESGVYDVGYIYVKDGVIMCHLDFPTYEVDVNFDDLTLSERQAILIGVRDFIEQFDA